MIWQSGEMLQGLLLLLAKGSAWLALCGLVRWVLPGAGLSWRVALMTLLLLSAASLLPALWTWTLPRPVPATQTSPPPTAHPVLTEKSNQSPDTTPLSEVTKSAPAPASIWPWQDWLALLWLGGTSGLTLWLITGFRTARRWIRHAVPLTDPAWQKSLTEECQRQSLRRIPRLLVNPEVPGPCVAGCFRPALLLPACCQDWDQETRTLVLRHELAHVRRGDSWHAWVRALALTIHWLNPLVWIAVSRSRRDEELAADAAVLASGTPPDHYATTLVSVARSCQFTTLTPLVSAMAHSSTLEFRIRHLLGKKFAPQSPARFAAAGIGLSFLTAGFIGCSNVQQESHDPNDRNLPGARTPNAPIDTMELKKLFAADPSTAKRFLVKCHVIDLAGRDLNVPGIEESNPPLFAYTLPLRPGQKGRLETIREFPYPTRYVLPKLSAFTPVPAPPGGGSFPVTPTVPMEFKFRNIGWEASQLTVRQDGAMLMVSGTFQETTFDGFIQNAGEAFSPIITKGRNALGMEEEVVLTDNKVLTPAFTQRETPFTVAALPGTTYRIRLNLKHPDAFLEISCTPEVPGKER